MKSRGGSGAKEEGEQRRREGEAKDRKGTFKRLALETDMREGDSGW